MRNVQAREEPCKKRNHGDAAPKGMRKLPELWPTALFRGFHASRARTPQAPSCAARLFSGLPRAFSRAFSCSVGECALRRPIGCKPRSSLRDALKCQTNARSRFQSAAPLNRLRCVGWRSPAAGAGAQGCLQKRRAASAARCIAVFVLYQTPGSSATGSMASGDSVKAPVSGSSFTSTCT